MKFIVCLALLCLASSIIADETAIPRDRQVQIVQDYLWATGRAAHMHEQTALAIEESDASEIPVKCGMSAVADFVLNRNRLERDIRAALGVDTLSDRPVLPLSYDSESGRFKIHYSKTGATAVYESTRDSDGDGVPDFVESVGKIADSVWSHIISDLGYPAPVSDSFYTEDGQVPDDVNPPAGGDGKYDIYLANLPSSYYGLTYLDSLNVDGVNGQRATSFMELDNDYQQFSDYKNRPLDAVRVTVAHEFFHAVQFGIDYTEAEDFDRPLVKRYWMEISSTWMEEEMYDHINDYYSYLPFFFEEPTRSLQQFNSFADLHPYGSAIFAVFLDEQFGPDVIRDTWLRCGEYGRGPHFLLALTITLDSTSNHTEDLSSAFARFALWNYFTGERADQAPNNIGYEEAQEYPEIAQADMAVHDDFDTLVLSNTALAPQHMAATYIRMVNGLALKDQIWIAGDSVSVSDTLSLVYKYSGFPADTTTDTLCVLRFVDSLFPPGTPESQRSAVRVPVSFIEENCPDYRVGVTTCELTQECSDTLNVLLDPDSVFQVDFLLDTLRLPWWIITVDQLQQFPDSHEVEADPAPSAPTRASVVTYNPERICSQTLIVSAASWDYHRYVPTQRLSMAYLMQETRDSALMGPCGYDTTRLNIPPAVLFAYPNPVRVGELDNGTVKFRFRRPTDNTATALCRGAFMVVDLYTVAGERIATVSGTGNSSGASDLEIEVEWSVRNAASEQVASGVYLGYARLYCDVSRQELLAESTVKVAVIR